ncbi:MAG TPA: undecaprenyl-phosphate glucose phosphotransferase [Burkholderiaceae bacterium]|nr:undecaprenyl-phosphate glucose phosphotransferase [Burkholderiaceae bacterium]
MLGATNQGRSPHLRRTLTLPGAVQAALDPLVILAWLLALASYLGETLDPRALVAGLLLFALTFPGNGAFTDSVGAVVRKSVMTAFAVLAALALFDYASAWLKTVPRHILLPWFIALPVVLVAANLLARALLRRVLAASDVQETVVVCGVNDVGIGLAKRLRANPYFGVRVLGYFDDRSRDRLSLIDSKDYLGGFDQLSDFVRSEGVDRIYLALPMATQPRIIKLLEELKNTTASIYFAPDVFVTELINGRIESVDGLPVVAVRDTPFLGINGVVKRIEDIVLSSLALLLVTPLLLGIAVAVRLDSPGPIFFRQRRYGLDGREIDIFKFRTMRVVEDCADQYAPAMPDDQRITRVGRVLRRYSLDELPQLVNVMQGRMSLVGPRPHVVAVNEHFRKLIPDYMLRHKVKPGITGLAQVRGQRGGNDVDAIRMRIASDLEYLRNWTLGMDLAILVRTVPVLLGDKRAF